jgi:hypothetical protein
LSQKTRKKAMHLAEFIGKSTNLAGPTWRRRQLTSRPMTDKEQTYLTIITGDLTGSERFIHKVVHS